MTTEEAIKILGGAIKKPNTKDGYLGQAIDMAIDALKKQIPMKPKYIDKHGAFDGNWKAYCPVCNKLLMERITNKDVSYPRHYHIADYCTCGQRLYWEWSNQL